MKKLSKQEIEELKKSPQLKVVLTNKFGINPVVYVPLFYAILLLAITVWFLYMRLGPNAGQYFLFDSVPQQAAVFVDKKYIGTTPIKSLQTKGMHEIQIVLPHYTNSLQNIEAKSILLLRKLRAKPVKVELSPELIAKELKPYATHEEAPKSIHPYWQIASQNNTIIATSINQLASWNITNVQTNRYSNPPILKTQITQLWQSLALLREHKNKKISMQDTGTKIDNIIYIIFNTLYHSLPYIGSIETLLQEELEDNALSSQVSYWLAQYTQLSTDEDYIRFTKIHAQEEGYKHKIIQLENFYKATVAKNQVNYWNIQDKGSDNIDNLPQTLRIMEIDFSKVPNQKLFYALKSHTSASPNDPVQSYIENIATEDAHTNIEVLAKTIKSAELLEVDVKSFYIMNNEITQAHFAMFLKDINLSIEEWKALSLNNVSPDHQSNHFVDYNPQKHPHRPLRYITWYDAKRYVNWLNEKTREYGFSASLPNEYQWQAAVQRYPEEGVFNMDNEYLPNSTSSLQPSLYGNLWEWGSSWYSPFPQHALFEGPRYGSEKHIFGGSYISNTQDILADTPVYKSRNTAHLPDWASPYLGFRVILSPIQHMQDDYK